METNAVELVSKLTTIPEKNLIRLQDIYGLVACDAVEDAILKGENFARVDLNLGILDIKFEDNELKFRFRPGAKFEEELIDTIVNKHNRLTHSIETSLVNKITQTYKDLM